LLYAVCQQRIPVRGLIAVGIFYGFILWIVGSLIIGMLLSRELRVVLRSWTWLGACVLYGLGLAGAAVWAEATRSKGESVVVPKD
jgi:hypothetical protein